MVPLKDNIPTDRMPVVTLLLIAANLVGHLLFGQGGLFQLLVNVAFPWWFGSSVEDAMAPWRFVLLCLLGGAAAVGLGAALDGDAPMAVVAAAGVVATLVGAHVSLYPGARFVTGVPLPFLLTLVELPGPLLAAVWLALQALVAATGAEGAVVVAAPLAGVVVGAVAVRLLAQQRKQVPARRAEVALP
ncbi:rhomboid family intramembrane serine protease [Conexibacter sp. JD483]|uniref:rhomboid family intramembrane serine protease n=1 Tax=unclassified Conexibacter TaxID=2627773 RepID=UPI002723F8C2|nr:MULTISPECIES: rhomboid family intramembrane serine protease [unclassified Conexibacter]MDO8186985.1 rhomboid family intramembrane serine protease [Conexibacter sp. CPCC 205706]MDO8200697.1 rhomboid family intramembrane serine protease [Conexibacter sp. CPCC 205762]MDR9371478.1 rhomboid family intramembrane serine protease [Conexibacter sp. JD483]